MLFSTATVTPKVKVTGTLRCNVIHIMITQLIGVIQFYKVHKNVQIYHLISYWFVNIHNGRVPQYGICLPCGPINMGISFYY